MPEKYLKHERQVTLRMLENQKEDPVKQAFKNWYKLVFKSHPYSLDTSGTIESLKAMNPKVLTQIHQKHLKEEITLITYCGDHDLETVIAKLEKSLAPLKGRKGVAPRKNKLTAINGKRLEIDMPREQVQMVIGRPAFKLTDVKDIYLKMITAHLSGQGSELFVEVRDRQGLCYAVQPVHVTALEAGCWGIYIGAGADKKERAEIAILNILNRIGNEGISREEFDRVKSMLDGQQQLSVQTNEDFAQFYSVPALHGLGLEFQHDANEKVSLTKYEEFQEFLKEFMKGPWNTVIVGPNSPS
jgi:zinc protease